MRNTPESELGAAASADRAGQDGTPSLRAYTRPQLVEYGPLAKLTQGSASGTNESTPTGAMRMCL